MFLESFKFMLYMIAILILKHLFLKVSSNKIFTNIHGEDVTEDLLLDINIQYSDHIISTHAISLISPYHT